MNLVRTARVGSKCLGPDARLLKHQKALGKRKKKRGLKELLGAPIISGNTQQIHLSYP